MHQQGSFVSPILSDVLCQCRSEEYRLSDPGGGVTGVDVGVSSLIPATKDEPHVCAVCGGPEQEHRLKVLFQILDVNRDGGICVNDLTIGLKKLGLHRTEHELRVSITDTYRSRNLIFNTNKNPKKDRGPL
ncbi:Calcium-binding mitochondrial carrier protein SCaMC-2 [Bagarius yarrelli]|uniref:Calcium-binding mitochondrial carrier protein SCaMC-2 n=1 Tax=Bagarius yarrelli TaxID=175774 RepID=A0A556TIB0_BAGYA|nr:Calcium-binding mitochondrial carrier protein SCaMC-2 [Bagarius yarrelli]